MCAMAGRCRVSASERSSAASSPDSMAYAMPSPLKGLTIPPASPATRRPGTARGCRFMPIGRGPERIGSLGALQPGPGDPTVPRHRRMLGLRRFPEDRPSLHGPRRQEVVEVVPRAGEPVRRVLDGGGPREVENDAVLAVRPEPVHPDEA